MKEVKNKKNLDINDDIIINLREISHIMHCLYEGKGSQKRILIVLNDTGKITQRKLTKELGIQPGSASEVITKLENNDCIIKTANETDHRTIDIELTEKGKKLALEANSQRHKRHEEMFSCLSDDEKKELVALLKKVNTDWKERYHDIKKKKFRPNKRLDSNNGG